VSFVGVLETVGKDFAKGLTWAVTYAVPAEKLAALLFPSAAPALTAVTDATVLLQNAVLLVEQKYAAAGVQNGTGPQKLAEVVLLTQSVLTGLLGQAGVGVTSSYLQDLVSAVVAILNVQAVAPAKA
jgi:hypothetical protein